MVQMNPKASSQDSRLCRPWRWCRCKMGSPQRRLPPNGGGGVSLAQQQIRIDFALVPGVLSATPQGASQLVCGLP